MAEKQAPLNGAYYGPSIPPAASYHRPGRGGDCGGCCCCLLKLFFEVVLTLVFLLGLAALIVWLIFRPINVVKFHVTDAELTQFSLTSNDSILLYNLGLNLTIRNPNKKIGIYYDLIESRAIYEGQRFDTVYSSPFYQGHKNTTVLSPVFVGQQAVVLGGTEVNGYNSDKSAGVYNIDVKLYLRVRFRLGKLKTFRFKPRIDCDLMVPLSSGSGSTTTKFQPTKCDINWRVGV
ncbi:hypothetical protein MLD38_035566 [Melastoma candidum]|uniref:Uncharacterized protein n=1 Tax=Melastoma candidum TaxID=119954 RepID=A0ACB9LGK6_9MYRT|nr:hypothetical protein MLD38_035566 [Melastoma candidum]